MAIDKNVKSKIWVYAVVLFMSAFIVLLFAAYSQIKINKNLSDYKNQVSNQQKQNKKIQLSFTNAQEVNDRLKEENKKLSEENTVLNDTISMLEAEALESKERLKIQIEEYEKFSTAQTEYFKGNVYNCTQLLKEIDADLFDLKTRELYSEFSIKVNDEAGKSLFDEGYSLYKKGKNYEALEKLSMSRDVAPKAKYADKCLYYLARVQFKVGLKPAAIENMKTFIIEFPDSLLLKNAKSFIKNNT